MVDSLTLVEVTWRDAAFALDDEPRVMILHTVGWIVKEDDEVVIVASERDSDATYLRSRTAVPRECIVEIRGLTRGRRRST